MIQGKFRDSTTPTVNATCRLADNSLLINEVMLPVSMRNHDKQG